MIQQNVRLCSRQVVVEARRVHNPKVVGSNPTAPTSNEPLGAQNVVRTLEREVVLAYWVFSILASDSFTSNFLSLLRPIFVLLAFYLASCGAISSTIFADWLATHLTLAEL